MNESLLVSVVIPNYNGRKLLELNLPPLYECLNRSNIIYEIIITDDASTDDSIDYIKSNYPEIVIVTNPVNRGFSYNCNQGFKNASYDWILCLNTDVKVEPDYINQLKPYFEIPNLFSLGGTIWGYDEQLQDAGKFPEITLQGLKTTVDFEPIAHTKKIQTLFNSGACVFYHKTKLLALNGYNEIFSPFYYEDAEIGIRAWRMGWECWLIPQAKCYHPNSVTIKKHNKELTIKKIAYRNKLMMGWIHYDGMLRFTFICLMYIKLLVSWFGKSWYYQSFFDFLRLKKQWLQTPNKNVYTISLSEVIDQLKLNIQPSIKRLF